MKKLFLLFFAAFVAVSSVQLVDMPAVSANDKVFRKVTPEQDAQSVRYREEADAARKAGDYEQAVALYTKAIHLNERRGGYVERGYCYLKLGRYDRALHDARTAIPRTSAKDLIRPGISGMAPYIETVCAYHLGDIKTAVDASQGVVGTPYAKEPEFQSIMEDLAKNPAFIARAVTFQESSVAVLDGETIIEGTIRNTSAATITIHRASIAIRATDIKGKASWSDAQTLEDLGIEVLPGQKVAYTFHLVNPRCKEITEEMRWKLSCKFQ